MPPSMSPRALAIAHAVALLVALCAAVVLAPWFEVANHPVRLELEAPRGSHIEICWTETACLPFVAKEDKARPDLWLAELPPARSYRVSLKFPDGIADAVLHRLVVVNTAEKRAPETTGLTAPILDFRPVPADGIRLELPAGSRFDIGSIPPRKAPKVRGDGAVIFAVIASVLCGSIFLLARIFNAPVFPAAPLRQDVRIPWGTIAVASFVHVILVLNTSADFHVGDDIEIYARLALNLMDHGIYGIPGADPYAQTVRTPGYPAFLAIVFGLLGGTNLSVAVLCQAVLAMASIVALAVSLRHWISRAAIRVIVIAGALGPPTWFTSRMFFSDGLAAAMTLFAIAAFLEAAASMGRRRHVMLCLFSLAAAYGALTRPTVIVVFVLPILGVLINAARNWRANRAHWPGSAFRESLPLLLTAIPVVVALSGWAVQNKVRFNFFGITSYGEFVRFASLMETGTFDVRALTDKYLYDRYLIGREAAHYFEYHIQFTAPLSSRTITDRARYVDQLNAGLKAVTDRSESIVDPRLLIASVVRNIWWGAVFPVRNNFGGYPLVDWSYLGGNPSLGDQSADAAAVRHVFPRIVLDLRQRTTISSLFLVVINHYGTINHVLFILGAIAGLVSIGLGGVMLAAPVLVYSANLLLYSLIGLVYGRYIQVLDVLLIAQIAVAVTLAWELASLGRPR